MIFKSIISMLTSKLSLCVIAVDWSGYPSQEYHVLRASLICDGRSIPLLSHIVPSSKQNSSEIQKGFLNALAETIKPETKVIVITDAGFRNAWFSHIKSLGWDFVGRIRGNTQLQLNNNGEGWLRTGEIIAGDRPEYLGEGTLSQSTPCDGHFYIQKRNRRDENISVPAVVSDAQNRFVVVVQQRKSRGFFSSVVLNLSLARS